MAQMLLIIALYGTKGLLRFGLVQPYSSLYLLRIIDLDCKHNSKIISKLLEE